MSCTVGGASSRKALQRSRIRSKAPLVRAENGKIRQLLISEEGMRLGASSRITCALVPPTPREFTAARRGFSGLDQLDPSATTRKGLLAKSNRLLGFLKFKL